MSWSPTRAKGEGNRGPKTTEKNVPLQSHTWLEKSKLTMNRTSAYQLMMLGGNIKDPSCPLPHLISQRPFEVGTIEIVIPTLQMRKQAPRQCMP